MKSTSKRRKSIDRISNLPNSIITHILSFLSTKDAVRTSVLSTKWIHQWTSVTHLDFEDQTGIRNGNGPQSSFLNFVYRVLLFKVTHLDLFRLKTWRGCDVAHINLWISAALSRHVRQIDLSVHTYSLPPPPWPPLEPQPHGCLFSSRTLVILKVGMGFLLKVPSTFSLDSLKILHFHSVEFEDSESLSRLVSSCPVLEELKMEGELSETMDVLSISSFVLKRLILKGLHDEHDFYPYKVVLNTPSLKYFEHVDEGAPEGYLVAMKTLHSLDRAYLCLHLCEQYDLYRDKSILQKSMANLAVAISNVRFLYLSENAFESFSHSNFEVPIELPMFPRLTDLEIDAIALYNGMGLLVAFLQASPQLEFLSFALSHELLPNDWDPPTAVPFCMQHNLKVIEVEYFTGRPLEHSMIKYFLGKTISLEELIISASPETNLAIIKKLLKLPKASKSCKVEFT